MKTLTALNGLPEAEAGSYYTICGTADPIADWLEGYEKIMSDLGVGRPQEWFRTTGSEVNSYAKITRARAYEIHPHDRFPDELPILLFSLDGLDVGKLAIMKLRMEDRWFDDIIQNMRVIRVVSE